MTHPPILLNDAPEITPCLVAPFTHTITLKSGPWAVTARLELPDVHITITPSNTPGLYTLEVVSPGLSSVEIFDKNLAHFMSAVSSACKRHYPYSQKAIHHLLQGMAQAMTYFGLQYGYLRMVGGDTIEATEKREDS